MTVSTVVKLIREALLTGLYVALPVLGTSLIIGLVISIFQTTTSIQEQTLTFVPKIVGIALAIMLFSSFMLRLLVNFASNLFLSLPNVVR